MNYFMSYMHTRVRNIHVHDMQELPNMYMKCKPINIHMNMRSMLT